MHYSWFYNYLLSRIQECRELSTKKYQATSVTGTLVKQSEGKPVLRYSSYVCEYPSQNRTNQPVQDHEEIHEQNQAGTQIIHIPDL